MAEVPFDLSAYADTLGDPNAYFVDEHAGAYRLVRHSDGVAVGVLHPAGAILPLTTLDPERIRILEARRAAWSRADLLNSST